MSTSANEELPATRSGPSEPAAVVLMETGRFHQYQRRPGTNAVAGYRFEANLLALVLYRLQHGGVGGNRRSFLLGWNVDGIGDYDDLVVRCWTQDDGREATTEKVYFVQTKHKDKSDAVLAFEEVPDRKQNGGGKVCLKKLVDSYEKVRDQFKGSKSPLFRESGENIEMILYTNARVEINQEVFNVAKAEGSGLFSSSGGQVLSLSKNDSEVELEREALSCFRIYECQANQMELEALLKAEIRDCYGGDEHYIFTSYFDQIRNYGYQQGSDVEFLTEKCPFFEIAKVRDYMKSAQPNSLLSGDVLFTPDAVESLGLDSFMRNPLASSLVVLSRCPTLSNAKIIQHLERSLYKDSFAYVDADLVKIDNLIISEQVLKPLVIFGTKLQVVEGIREELRGLSDHCGKYIVILGEEHRDAFRASGLKIITDTSNFWTNLTLNVQNEILKETHVVFQNKQINLNQLIGDIIPDHRITDSLLLDLLQRTTINLASPNIDTESTMRNYIDRKFRRLDRIAGGFRSEPSLFCVVKHATARIPDEHIDIVIVADKGDQFERICQRHVHRNVHWLKQIGASDEFVWQRSINSLKNIRAYWRSSGTDCEVETFDDFDEKVVILAAEPGMGKSTVLTGLTENTLDRCDIMWIVRINLVLFCIRLKDMLGCCMDFLQVIHFIWEAAGGSARIQFRQCNAGLEVITASDGYISEASALEAQLFASFYNTERLIVLADGFDEIAPGYTEPVLSLLKVLQNSSVRKLIVTTRNTHVQTVLEERLSSFSYTLVPFNREDAKRYLSKYWNPDFKRDAKEWNELAEDLMNQFSKTLIVDREHFLGVPLHIQMIAMCVEGLSEDCKRESKKMNLLTLYENFIDIKVDIFLLEKNKLHHSSPILGDLDIRSMIEERHRLLAQYALFSEDELQILQPKRYENIDKCLQEVVDGKQKQGIVCRIVNGKPQFVHLTFAEYFAAAALWDLIKAAHVKDFERIVRVILLDDLVANERIQICQFVQLLALEHPKDFGDSIEKMRHLLKQFDLTGFRTKNNAWKLLLGIAESAILNDRGENLVGMVQSMDSEDKMKLLDMFAHMGYANLLHSMKGIVPVGVLRAKVTKGYWRQSALWKATERGQLDVIKVLVDELGYDVTWLDQHNRSFVSGIFKDKKYRELETLAKAKIEDCSGPYIFRGELHLPIISALQDGAPKAVVEALLDITDTEMVNEFPCPDMGWYLHDPALIEQFHGKGVDLFIATSTEHYVQTKGINLEWLNKIDQMIECGVGIDQSRALLHIRQLNYVLRLLAKSHAEFGKQNAAVVLKLIITYNYESTVTFSHFRDVGRFYSKSNEWFGFCMSPEKRFDTLEDLESPTDARESILRQLGLVDDVPGGSEEMKDLLSKIYHCGGMSVLLEMLGHLRKTGEQKDHWMEIVNQRVLEAGKLQQTLEDSRKLYLELIESIRERALTRDRCKRNSQSIIDSQDVTYGSPLHYAVSQDDKISVEALLKCHANPNCRLRNVVPSKLCASILNVPGRIKDNLEHCTPLHLAAARGNLPIVKMLCKNNANVRASTAGRNFTPLHFAAENGHAEIVRFLLAQPAIKPNATADLNLTPLALAKQNDHQATASILENFNAQINYTDLHHAAATNDYEQLSQILQNHQGGVDPNEQTTTNGYTPLHVAAENGHLEVGLLLLEHGADRTIASSDKFYTAFDIAVNNRHEKLAHAIRTHSSGASRFELTRS